MDIGIFSESVFHPEIYDTGDLVTGKSKAAYDDTRARLLKEDEEILVLMAAINQDQ